MAVSLGRLRTCILIAGLATGALSLEAIATQREYPEPTKPSSKPKPAPAKPKPAPAKKPTTRPKPPAAAPSGSPDKYVEQGDQFASDARWAEAEAEYRKAVKIDPNNVKWHISLAIALTRQNKYADAEAEYREAARIEPTNAQWHAGVGDRLAEQQKYPQAETAYREAVRLEPENVFWRTYLGFVLARQKKYAEAEAEYRKAAQLDPNNATRYAAVGDRLVEQFKYAEAEIEYRRSVTLEPNNARWRDYLGYVLIKQQKWAEAEKEYKEAVRLDPSEPRYQELLKEVSTKASERSASGRGKKNESPSRPQPPADSSAQSYITDGDRLAKEKRWAEAESAYKQAAKLEANNAVLHTKLAIALSAQQKQDEAEVQHRKAVRLEPNKALWHYNLGMVLSRQGKNAEAEAELREAVRLDPKNVQYQGTWKQVSDSLGTQTNVSPQQVGARTDVAVNPSGVWSIEVRAPQGNLQLGFKLSYEGERLTGAFLAQNGTWPIQKATLSGNQLRFISNIKIGQVTVEATVTGLIKENLISGAIEIPGRGSFEFAGSKAK